MSRRWDGWSATASAAGVACVVLYAGAAVTVLGLPGTESSGAEVARYAASHRTLLLGGSYLWGVAIVTQMVFAAALWVVLRPARGAAAVANLGGLAGAVGLSVLTLGSFGFLATLAFRPEVEPAMARTLADVFALTLAYAGLPAALWSGASSLALLSVGRYRAWIAWLGLAAALLHLVVAGSLARSGFLSPSGPPGLIAPVLIVAWIGSVAVAVAAARDARLPRFLRVLTLRTA